MARPLRIEFPGAIYHVMSRGNARQTVFRDDSDYQRLIKGLETVVGRLGWDLLCFVLMPNHFHLLVRTPRPNLCAGNAASHIRIRQLVQPTSSASGAHISGPVQE